MSNSSGAPQCCDPNCTRPPQPNIESQCHKCQRSMHATCGVQLEGDGNERMCAPCAGSQNPRKSKRRRLNLSEKMRALDMMESGVTLQDVADEFGSSKRAILRMRQEAEVIRNLSQTGAKGSMKSRKQGMSQKYNALESKVAEMLDVSRRNKVSISSELIRECSRKVQEEMLSTPQLSEGEAKDLQEFAPTDFWIRSFSKRHSIRFASSRALHTPVTASEAAMTPECISLKNELLRYDPECIFSVLETTLFHKTLPRDSYLTTTQINVGDSMLLFPDDMGMKDRLTLIFCANATGTMKIPLTIVGKSKQPACFRIRPSPLPYLAQPHLWFDTATFKQWFSEVFIPAIRKHSWKNVALLVESVIEENIANDPRGQVKIMRLPPDSRTVYHPMEQGIMTLVKQRYRYAMLERVLELFPFREAIQACNVRKNKALRGLDDGYDPNILDSAELLDEVWRDTSAQCMARSWISTNVLPDSCNAALFAKHGRSRSFGKVEILMDSCNVRERERIERVNSIIRIVYQGSNRQASGSVRSPLTRLCSGLSEERLQAWLCLEDRAEIREALVREAQDTVLRLGYSNSIDMNGAGQENNDIEEGDGARRHSQFLPSVSAISELFVPLEELASVSESGDAANYLRQAKRTLLAVKIKEMGSSASQQMPSNAYTAAFVQPNR